MSIPLSILKSSNARVDDKLLAVACTTIYTELLGELADRGLLPASATACAAYSALLHCYLSRGAQFKIHTHTYITPGHSHLYINSALTHFHSKIVISYYFT